MLSCINQQLQHNRNPVHLSTYISLTSQTREKNIQSNTLIKIYPIENCTQFIREYHTTGGHRHRLVCVDCLLHGLSISPPPPAVSGEELVRLSSKSNERLSNLSSDDRLEHPPCHALNGVECILLQGRWRHFTERV